MRILFIVNLESFFVRFETSGQDLIKPFLNSLARFCAEIASLGIRNCSNIGIDICLRHADEVSLLYGRNPAR